MTNDAPTDQPGTADPDPGQPAEPARPKRRLFGLSYHWVGAIAGVITALGTLIGALVAFMPTVAASDEVDRTVTETVARTVTETDTVQATPSTSPGATTPGVPSATSGPTTSAGVPATTPRLPDGTPGTTTTTTTTVVPPVAPPARSGDPAVRFTGELAFGSVNLDYQQPRDLPGHNVYRIQESRLYADDLFLLVEWPTDSVPGHGECAAKVSANGKRDATGLVAGSQVCGRTPEGRVFRIEVLGVSANEIRGRVTVWER